MILSLPAFLAFKESKKLETIGQFSASRAGGLEYQIVSKTASSLADCKGNDLATDHADDPSSSTASCRWSVEIRTSSSQRRSDPSRDQKVVKATRSARSSTTLSRRAQFRRGRQGL